MTMEATGQIVRLEAAQQALRRHFLGWQCRLRQLSVREAEGRPTSGMCPKIVVDPKQGPVADITVLVVHEEPETVTAEFRHMVRRTHDPAERRKSALRYLSAHYYQYPDAFSDEITALFGPRSDFAESLLRQGFCELLFEQYQQRYRIPCRPRRLSEEHPKYQATLWHNRLFNPHIPGGAIVLAFSPDWSEAEANPPAR